MDRLEESLVALRRILRATDLHARKLAKETGLSTSQLLVLQIIAQESELTVGKIASEMNLTQATITNIVDRLEERGLVQRERGTTDKRKVFVNLTEEGRRVLAAAPTALQDRFSANFHALEDWEQGLIVAVLQRVAAMMGAAELDVGPVLDSGKIDRHPTTSP